MNKFKFILIFLVFILPFFFAMYFYQSNVTQSIGTKTIIFSIEKSLLEIIILEKQNTVLLQVLPNNVRQAVKIQHIC